MTDETFSILCHVCGGKVNSFTQSARFILFPRLAAQEAEIIELSCGCTIDFPDWQIDIDTGLCRIYNYAGQLFLQFIDEEVLMEGDE
jgi:hypothetical protein